MTDPATRAQGTSTLAVHAGAAPAVPGAPVVAPLVASATFHSAIEPDAEVLYGRYANAESHQRLGVKLAALEGAEAALAVGSGMAAISLAILGLTGSGDHIVAADSLYGGTLALLTRELPRLGIETTFVRGQRTGRPPFGPTHGSCTWRSPSTRRSGCRTRARWYGWRGSAGCRWWWTRRSPHR
jgi:O-acetylhomoserine/O-acetylserine sulfhydrylase-like pyridoxal-dependent enzyme